MPAAAPPRCRPAPRSESSDRPRRPSPASGTRMRSEGRRSMSNRCALAAPGRVEPVQHLRPARSRGLRSLGVARAAGVVRHGQAAPCGDRGLVRLPLVSRKRRRASAPTSGPPNRSNSSTRCSRCELALRLGADQDQLAGMRQDGASRKRSPPCRRTIVPSRSASRSQARGRTHTGRRPTAPAPTLPAVRRSLRPFPRWSR